MDRWEDMVLVGIITRPHGLRGEVLVQPETDFPETRFAEGATVFAWRDGAVVALDIDRSRGHLGRPLIGFRGLESIEAVQRLGRSELRVPESSLEPLPEGAYYWYQYVGARVQTEAGEVIGHVIRVEPNGGAGMLVVDRDGSEEVQIPLVPALCPVLRPDVIVVRPPEGLLEINARVSKRRESRHRHHLSRHGAGRPAGRDPGPGGGAGTA